MNHKVLEVKNLSVKLNINQQHYKVVDDISFALEHGKTLAVVGESGCGKTMVALSLLRILPAPLALHPEGEIIYKERNLLNLSENEMRKIRGSRISMIFQDPSSALNPVYTIGDQIFEVAQIHLNISFEEAFDKVVHALEEVGLSNPVEILDKYPHQLSGGMKQRVMIAMALLCEPDILIADEPTTALDVTIQAQVLRLMKDLQQKKGMAILLITHDMGVVAEMADDVLVLYASQVMERGGVFQIFDQMAHPYTQGLFNSRPKLGTADSKGLLPSIKGYVPSLTNYPEGCRFHPRCPYVMAKCRQGPVPDFVLSNEPLHQSKCWLYDSSEESALRVIEVKNATADH